MEQRPHRFDKNLDESRVELSSRRDLKNSESDRMPHRII